MKHFPIIDSHLHFLHPVLLDYPWLDSMPMLNQIYSLPEWQQASSTLSIQGLIFVQAECHPSQALAEVAWVTDLAKQEARIHGIVAHAPLELGKKVDMHLHALRQNPLVKGVRRILQFEKDPAFCLQANFIQAVQMLAEFNLSFDICISENQLPYVIRLIEQCPDTQFILDHIGKPNIAEQQLQPWKDQLQSLSTFENVCCKLSGLITEADHLQWKIEDLKPYLLHTLDVFGFDRVMFGSDWPVVNLAGNYERWTNTLFNLLQHVSFAELQKLFFLNAQKYYQLPFTIRELEHV